VLSLVEDALPANIYMITLLEKSLEEDYDSSRITDSLTEEKGFHLQDDMTLNDRIKDGRYSYAVWNSGFLWGPPSTVRWNSVAFQPILAVLRRYFKCQE